MPLIGNALQTLAKSVLIALGLTAEASAMDAVIRKKVFGSGMHPSTLIILTEEINDITKITKSLEDSGLWITCFSKTIKLEAKKQKGEFLGI